jgi:hypothetical protein
MTAINVIGSPSDKTLEEIILARLTQTYRVTYVKNKSLVSAGTGYDIVVADFAELKSLYVPECLIVLKPDAKSICGGAQIPLPDKTIIIANAENSAQLASLKNIGCTVVTCGSSEKDTMSCSSVSFDGIVASLNREITAFSGRTILPLEVPISGEPKDLYCLLAFTALRLILDDFNSDLGKLI